MRLTGGGHRSLTAKRGVAVLLGLVVPLVTEVVQVSTPLDPGRQLIEEVPDVGSRDEHDRDLPDRSDAVGSVRKPLS